MSDELKLWAYARSSSPRPGGLIRQMERLLADAGQNGWQIVGASQDMSTGKMLTRMGLREAQRAIRMKQANGILVESVGKISHECLIMLLLRTRTSYPKNLALSLL